MASNATLAGGEAADGGGALDSVMMMNFLAAVFISIYLNMCFLVAEAIFIAHGPQVSLEHTAALRTVRAWVRGRAA